VRAVIECPVTGRSLAVATFEWTPVVVPHWLPVQKLTPDNFTPKIITRKPDYLYVEYTSPLLGVSVACG
jgi:hypothetical protein